MQSNSDVNSNQPLPQEWLYFIALTEVPAKFTAFKGKNSQDFGVESFCNDKCNTFFFIFAIIYRENLCNSHISQN